MATFQEIVAQSEATRHEIYHYLAPNGQTYSAPSPSTANVDPIAELQRLRTAERQERAARLAELVERGGLDQCEVLNVNIAGLIEEPEHISLADGDMPVVMNLIREIAGS